MNNETHVMFKRLHPDAKLPTRGSETAAGYDVYASQHGYIAAGKTDLVPLGFAAEMHRDVHAQVKTRSGLGLKGVHVLAGIIDADYRGEWKVILHNSSGETFTFAPGDRVAQIVLSPTVTMRGGWVDELSDTQRGAGGYGSTGR